jgi:hypothetical protein
MKLKSFGCSFTYGSDLHDCIYAPFESSYSTWPALLANSIDAEYSCYAHPGIGNLQIYQTVLDQVILKDSDFFVVNWTWLDRFDYIDPLQEHWNTLRPDSNTPKHQLYYRYFYNQYHTVLTTGSYISSTIGILNQHNIKFIMTLMDETFFEDIDPNWQLPRPVKLLQDNIKNYITKFNNKTFLEFSKEKGFPISKTLHPLEDAHQAAFELIKSDFDAILHKV